MDWTKKDTLYFAYIPTNIKQNKSAEEINCSYFLAALSSSRSLVVGPLVGWLFDPSVRLSLWKSDLKSIKR